MADASETIRQDPKTEGGVDMISDAAARVKASVEQLVEEIDLQAIVKRVEEFGRENPAALALTALGVGITAGLLMRNPRKLTRAS